MEDWREELLYTMNDTNGCYFKEYVFPITEEKEHEHCSICFAKISGEVGDYERCGYYCKKTGDWLCRDCFNDFKKRFDWSIEEV